MPKDFVCRKLMIIGTAASVPTLAGLLSDKDLSHMARFALERNSRPRGSRRHLRDALPKLNGALKIGVISSLGVRRDADSVAPLASCLADSDPAVARAAAFALGDIRTFERREGARRREVGLDAKSNRRSPMPACFAPKDCWPTAKRPRRWRCSKPMSAKISPSTFAWPPPRACWLAPARMTRSTAVRIGHFLRCGVVSLCAVLVFASSSFAKDEPSDELVQMVVKLLSEKDKDLRAVGLDQIRNEAKGAAATKQFAAQLPKLSAAEQVALLSALADRGDDAALPAVIELLNNSDDETVRVAAVTTIGSLGDSTDLALLLKALANGSAAEKTAAKSAVQRLRGEDVPGAIAAALKNSPPPMCVVLIEVLAERRALTTVGDLLTAATGDDAKVRRGRDGGALAIGLREPSARHVQGRAQSRKRHGARGCRKSGRRRCRRD